MFVSKYACLFLRRRMSSKTLSYFSIRFKILNHIVEMNIVRAMQNHIRKVIYVILIFIWSINSEVGPNFLICVFFLLFLQKHEKSQ